MKKLFTLSLLALVSMLTFAQDQVEITSEQTIEFSYEEAYINDRTDDYKLYQLIGEKSNGISAYVTFASTDLPTTTITYDYVNVIADFTSIRFAKNDYEGVACFDLKATVSATKATVDFYGTDGVLYHLIFNIREEPVEITSEQTVEFYIDQTQFIDMISTDGLFQFIGRKPNGFQAYVAFRSTVVDGTYKYYDTIYKYTAIQADYNSSNYIRCFDLNANVTKEKATVDFYGTDGVLYHFIFNTTDNPGVEYYDNGHEAFNAKYSWDEAKVNDSMSAVGLEVVEVKRIIDENVTECVNLEFNCSRGNAVTEIPVGTYEINDSGREMTVTACEIDSDYKVSGSFVANKAPDGTYYAPLWFLASGTVTVEDGIGGRHILVNAKTTWGMPVTIEIGRVATAIKDVNAVSQKTMKVVRDGQLRILSNGKEYNVGGMEIVK